MSDIRTGGGESVFVRMITQNMPKKISGYPLYGKMQVLYGLDLVERVGYAYRGDEYGTKSPTSYQNRSNIIELADKYSKEDAKANLGNEVCVRNRISPQFIKGVMVSDASQKIELVNHLRTEGLITQNAFMQDCINGILVDQFIHVGDLEPRYWN